MLRILKGVVKSPRPAARRRGVGRNFQNHTKTKTWIQVVDVEFLQGPLVCDNVTRLESRVALVILNLIDATQWTSIGTDTDAHVRFPNLCPKLGRNLGVFGGGW